MEQDWIGLLLENIEFQYRHEGYEQAKSIRKFSHMISTGIGQEEQVTRYRRFEADDLKTQRTKLYNPATKQAISRPRKYWKRVGRVENISRAFNSKDENKMRELLDAFKQFQPGIALEDWLIKHLEFLGVTDPNAWVVYERAEERGPQGQVLTVRTYPFTFSSENSLNFSFSRTGRLQWFLGRTIDSEVIYKGGTRITNTLENYYLYGPGIVASAREKGEKTKMASDEQEVKVTVYPPNSQGAVDRYFFVSIRENGTTEVPAMCAGVYMDEEVGLPTVFVPWFYPASGVLYDLIRDKSVADVLTIVHAYPRRWVFEPACAFEDEKGVCEGGYLNGDPHVKCPGCNGTGVSAGHTTEQASVSLVMPPGADAQKNLLELSKMSFVEPVDIGLLQLVQSRIEATEAAVIASVFDSGIVQKPTETKTRTATEISTVMDGISDVLSPFCNTVSSHFELATRVGAQYLEFEIQVEHSFPEDLDIMTLADEVALFKEVEEAGLGYEAKSAQRGRVLQKMHAATPIAQKQISAKYNHEPFAGRNESEIAFILSSRAPLDTDRVLWENFEAIFREIFNEDELFFEKNFAAQQKVVQAKVEEFKTRISLMDE